MSDLSQPTTTQSTESQDRAHDRLVRITALAFAAVTMLWLAGCGEPVDVDAVKQQRQDQAQAKQDAWQAMLNEGPTPIAPEDFPRIEAKEDVNALRGATSQAALRAKAGIKLMELQRNLDLFGMNPDIGYPESHEGFVKLMTDNGLTLPELRMPYEVWYDAQSHQIMKRPKADAPQEPPAEPAE